MTEWMNDDNTNEIKSDKHCSRWNWKYSLRAEDNIDLTIFVFAFRSLNGTGILILVVLILLLLFYKRNVYHVPFYHVVYGNSSRSMFGNECTYHWHIQNVTVERRWTTIQWAFRNEMEALHAYIFLPIAQSFRIPYSKWKLSLSKRKMRMCDLPFYRSRFKH